jgi:hypothetical protein
MSETISLESREEAAYLLRKVAIERGAELLGSHQWAWESARWKELAFALLARIAKVPEKTLRRLTNEMGTLGLLSIQPLANLAKASKGPDMWLQPHARHMVELLQENGFSEEQARQGITTIYEAALVLQQRYDGKVQKYLRSYGELMLKDLEGIFTFSALSKTEAADAFTYWLQNVLSMPLSLIDSHVQSFCRQHNIQAEELIGAADDVGLNLGFVDDLVYLNSKNAVAQSKK